MFYNSLYMKNKNSDHWRLTRICYCCCFSLPTSSKWCLLSTGLFYLFLKFITKDTQNNLDSRIQMNDMCIDNMWYAYDTTLAHEPCLWWAFGITNEPSVQRAVGITCLRNIKRSFGITNKPSELWVFGITSLRVQRAFGILNEASE